jgi:hypothetical protein
MKWTIIIDCLVVFTMLFLGCQVASSEIVTVEFEGIVNGCGARGSFAFDGSVNIGTPMSGVMTYDSTTADREPAINRGSYDIIAISMSIGNYTFLQQSPSSSDAFYVTGAWSDPHYDFSAASRFDGTFFVDGVSALYEDVNWYNPYFAVHLAPYVGTFPNDALPDSDSFPPLEVFNIVKRFEVTFYRAPYGDPSYFLIGGDITSLTVIPEPASILLFGLGILALRKKRK